jgi:hypothetical protein
VGRIRISAVAGADARSAKARRDPVRQTQRNTRRKEGPSKTQSTAAVPIGTGRRHQSSPRRPRSRYSGSSPLGAQQPPTTLPRATDDGLNHVCARDHVRFFLGVRHDGLLADPSLSRPVCGRRVCRTSCGPRGDVGNNPCSRQGDQVVAQGSRARGVSLTPTLATWGSTSRVDAMYVAQRTQVAGRLLSSERAGGVRVGRVLVSGRVLVVDVGRTRRVVLAAVGSRQSRRSRRPRVNTRMPPARRRAAITRTWSSSPMVCSALAAARSRGASRVRSSSAQGSPAADRRRPVRVWSSR